MQPIELIKKNWITVTLVMILFLSFLLRVWQLGKINDQIFDETYFVNFANNYLNHAAFFDIHPPLGKLIIALCIKLMGNFPFTWRFSQAVFGTLLICIGYLTGKELSSRLTGLFVAAIFALDGMLLVYSRLGLIDIFLAFFILLSFYLFLKFSKSEKTSDLFFAGIALGLAASIKYVGALTLLIFLIIIIVRKISWRKNWLKFIIFLILVPSTIYLAFFLFNFHGRDFFIQVISWHKQSFGFNLHLKDTHPYESKWWGWFLLLRPIWFYYNASQYQIQGIIGLGNPLAWWSAIIVVPILIWGTIQSYLHRNLKNDINVLILSPFLILWLFWAFFHRALFIYHAIPSFLFMSLGTACILERLLKFRYGKYFIVIYFLALLILFIYFLPLWVGTPLSSTQFNHRIWFSSWT